MKTNAATKLKRAAVISFCLALLIFLIPYENCMCGNSHGLPRPIITPSHGEFPGSIYLGSDPAKGGRDFIYWNIGTNFLFWFVFWILLSGGSRLLWWVLRQLFRACATMAEFVDELEPAVHESR